MRDAGGETALVRETAHRLALTFGTDAAAARHATVLAGILQCVWGLNQWLVCL